MNGPESILVLSLSLNVLHLIANRYHRGSPPGPKGLPILGNILDLRPGRNEPPWITCSNWSHTYGDIFTFSVLGNQTVVLNSYKVITELLRHRSHNYSDRPNGERFAVALLPSSGFSFVCAALTSMNMMRLHRRIFYQYFRPQAVTEYHGIQKDRTVTLIRKLGVSPTDFFQHVRMHASGIILEIIYGYRVQDNDDPYIKLADDGLAGINQVTPGTLLVDFIPMLKHIPAWFPGASFNAKVGLWAQDVDPDRFIKRDGRDLPPNPELIPFGFRRRICPGRYLAIDSIWLAMAYIFTKFTILQEVDSEGKDIDPVVEYMHGGIKSAFQSWTVVDACQISSVQLSIYSKVVGIAQMIQGHWHTDPEIDAHGAFPSLTGHPSLRQS
ncbi:cytochrome P450 [Marasmius fiardii PR-910]|nr:cytochrome P450 [Marasmius fiardii PR-910]